MSKSKCQNKSKCQMTNAKTKRFCHLVFGICAYFVICALVFGFSISVYAADLDKAQIKFLQGEYQEAINVCEDILSKNPSQTPKAEVYYLLGQCHIKLGNYLRAGDIFFVLINEYKSSPLIDKVYLGLGDTHFLREDFEGAGKLYQTMLKNFPQSELKGVVYFRLGQTALKLGRWPEAENYLKKVKQEFSKSFEAELVDDLLATERFFTVQVGSFGSRTNAQNLSDKLTQEGFSPYIVEMSSQGKVLYRVRIGKLNSRSDAQRLLERLKKQGYPTRIFP